MNDLKNWKMSKKKERKIFEGRYVRIEKMKEKKNGEEIFEEY